MEGYNLKSWNTTFTGFAQSSAVGDNNDGELLLEDEIQIPNVLPGQSKVCLMQAKSTKLLPKNLKKTTQIELVDVAHNICMS
eukprot:15364600-Ditylum_brightwellii.AAC.2